MKKPDWLLASEDLEFVGGASSGIANLFERIKILQGADVAQSMIRQRMGLIYKEYLDLKRLPGGSARARIIHKRIDKAIAGKFRTDPDTKSITCTHCPILGACCHINTDITKDEAELLAQRIREGVQIDMKRLEMQANINGEGSDKDRVDSWGTLSFEERACIFLAKDGKCNVYDDRPAACRKWFVAEKEPTCGDIDSGGMIYVFHWAEIIASAALNLQSKESGRLPNLILRELKKTGNEK